MNPKDELDPELMNRLSYLDKLPEREPQNAAAGKAKYLKMAQELAGQPSPVTPPKEPRRKNWIQSIQSIFLQPRKEHSPMFSTIATIMVIFSLILGAGGVTVVSAQSAQPDEPLYNVKLWSEDARLGLISDSKVGYQLALEFTNRRAEEISTTLAAGGVVPESVETRYQNQVEQAIRFALNLPDDQAIQALDQIQTRLQEQQQTMLQVKANGSENADAMLLQTRLMIQQRLESVQNALSDPIQAREQLQQQEQERNQEQNLQQSQEQNQNQNGQDSSLAPDQDTQAVPGAGDVNPWTTGTPTPGSSYGPGPGTDTGASNPWTTGTPTPGSGYGPGPGTGICTSTCDGPKQTDAPGGTN